MRQHQAERHARGFTCSGQFVAMLFCQLGQAHSLREICGGQRRRDNRQPCRIRCGSGQRRES
ncbi:MAG: DUF4372 domain-containing protein [Acidobacteriota bacterium]|nr:DUF4372 domain-containing protein [Acidobacteriota bacterium]